MASIHHLQLLATLLQEGNPAPAARHCLLRGIKPKELMAELSFAQYEQLIDRARGTGIPSTSTSK